MVSWGSTGFSLRSAAFHRVLLGTTGFRGLPRGSSVPTGVAQPNWQFVIFDDDKDMFITHVSPFSNADLVPSYFISSPLVVLSMVGIWGIRGPGTFYGVASNLARVSRIRNCYDMQLMSLDTGELRINI